VSAPLGNSELEDSSDGTTLGSGKSPWPNTWGCKSDLKEPGLDIQGLKATPP
jgi:hypothetical protein